MSHRAMTLFVQAPDSKQAKESAESFMQDWLEYEHAFFDAYEVLTESLCPLEAKQEELQGLETEYDPMRMAMEFLAKAETLKANQNFETAGFYYCRAGELYQKLLTDDIPFYNVSLRNYDIPSNLTGWFWIPVDYHC